MTTEHIQVLEYIVTLGRAATIDKWVENVFKTAHEMYWEGMEPEERARFLGDSLELLTEYLMKVNIMGNNQGLLNYTPVPLRDDYGVDATGLKNGVQIVVQCKYRHNPLTYVTYSDLARTFTHGVLKFGLDINAKKNLWLVTTGAGANTNCQKILGQRLHVLNRDHLKRQVDGNIDFWNGFLLSARK
ncbi:MAG: hypothetical protein PHF86_06305 [Candidatus Nanoarchaeia archaeon]|nr:hypothetical protein [Candidatus Nanoarchaeia archaeon]